MPLTPQGSLTLQGHPSSSALGSKPKRAMIIKLSEETLEALMARLVENTSDPPLDIELGDTPGIHIGSRFFPSRIDKENSAHELYTQTSDKPNAPLRYYARVEGKFTVERELSAKVAKGVKSSREELEQQSKDRKIQMLDTPPAMGKGSAKGAKKNPKKPVSSLVQVAARNESQRRGLQTPEIRSRVASPIPSTPPPTSTSSSQPPSHDPLTRKRLIHLLALCPSTSREVISKVGGKDCDKATSSAISDLLSSVALEDPPPKKSNPSPPPRLWKLRPESWLEVRPYDYPLLTDEERKKMALQGRTYLASMKIAQDDPRFQHVSYRPLASSSVEDIAGKQSASSSATDSKTRQTGRSIHSPEVNKLKKVNGTESKSLTPLKSGQSSKTHLDRAKDSSPLPSPPGSAVGTKLPNKRVTTPVNNRFDSAERSQPPSARSTSDGKRTVNGSLQPVQNRKHREDKSPTPASSQPKRPRSPEEVQQHIPTTTPLKRKRAETDVEYRRAEANGADAKHKVEGTNGNHTHLHPSSGGHRRTQSSNLSFTKSRSPQIDLSHDVVKGHQHSASQEDRRRTTKSTSVGSSKRRKSPIYTSSEDEDDDATPKPSMKSQGARDGLQHNSRDGLNGSSYTKPKVSYGAPLPHDRAALRRKYRSIYPIYLNLYQRRLEQQAAIENLLGNNAPEEEGEVDEAVELDDDVIMMDRAELERLNADCSKVEKELKRIDDAFRKGGNTLDSSTTDSR